MTQMNNESCHGVCGDLQSCSDSTFVPTCVHKLLWHVRNKGLGRTLQLVTSRFLTIVHCKAPTRPVSRQVAVVPAAEDVLDLQPGEWVEVRSREEIQQMLDGNGRYKGLLWMANMDRFCGRRYRVHKRVERMMLESNGEIRKLKHTVLLEGAMCENLYGCDRSCFHFWREAWLRRAAAEG